MLKDRDYASVVRLLNRTKAMTADDPDGQGDPADDIEFCDEVLGLLNQLRSTLQEEIDEGDPDVTTAFAIAAMDEVAELIDGATQLRSALSGDTRPAGYIPG